MSEAPERIWAYHAPDIEDDNPGCTIIAGESKMDFSQEYIRADLVSEPCVRIPEGHPDLNLAAWLDRRREQIGPWADYIIREVGKLEQEIANLRYAAPGWQTIKSAPVGIPVLAYCYGGEVLMTRITKHGEDEYARIPDLWMPLPKPPTKDSTHD